MDSRAAIISVVCMVGVSLFVVLKVVHADDVIRETSASGYEVVTLILKRHPSTKQAIEKAMSDNVVTESEYNYIRNVDESLNRDIAKKELRTALDAPR